MFKKCCTFIIAVCLLLSVLLITGCNESSSDPVVKELNTTMYFTLLEWDGFVHRSFEGPIQLAISDYAQQPDTIAVTAIPMDSVFNYSLGDYADTFQLFQDSGFPYYCGDGWIHQQLSPLYGGKVPVFFALDTDRGFMLLCVKAETPKGNPGSYFVGSLDPDVDPGEIADHFEAFLQYIVDDLAEGEASHQAK